MYQQQLADDRGFIMMEALVAVILLAIAIPAMLSAFTPAFTATGVAEETAVVSNRVRGTMDRVAALDFGILVDHPGNPVDLAGLFGSQAEADKESFTFKGRTYSPQVAVADASGGVGGLLELTVWCNGIQYKTLRAHY